MRNPTWNTPDNIKTKYDFLVTLVLDKKDWGKCDSEQQMIWFITLEQCEVPSVNDLLDPHWAMTSKSKDYPLALWSALEDYHIILFTDNLLLIFPHGTSHI